MRPLYIFDLDGTLADLSHRLHFLENKSDKRRWDKFHAACKDDTPKLPVISVFNSLMNAGSDVWVFSGRSNIVRQETVAWLGNHTGRSQVCWETFPELLTMRKHGDYTEDHLLKASWVDSMLEVDRERLVCVFDDRQRVVDMWRSRGIACMQVAPGDF